MQLQHLDKNSENKMRDQNGECLDSHLISKISSNYTSHHELSVLQPSNYSKYHIRLDFGRQLTHSVWPLDNLPAPPVHA